MPEGFGHWKTVHDRHRRWSGDGTWAKILSQLQAGCGEAEGKDWTVSADSTVVRAHQHAAGAPAPGPGNR
jgi:transposase